jgi:hypothetical protein
MSQSQKNESVDSSTTEMRETDHRMSRLLVIGVSTGLAAGFLTAIWIAGSEWLGMQIAVTLSVMGAAATLGGLMAVNFVGD